MLAVGRRSAVVDIVDDLEEESETMLSPCLEQIKHVKSNDGKILTLPFLDVCKLFLPLLDRLGPCMVLVKSDVAGNISKLEIKFSSDPSRFNLLYGMVQEDIDSTQGKSCSSCAIGLLWLTRSMDFLVEIFHNLLVHPNWSMSRACRESYRMTLRKWHGWFTASSFSVGMKLVPDKELVMEAIGGHGHANVDLERFCRNLSPLLDENHKFLATVGCDNQKVP